MVIILIYYLIIGKKSNSKYEKEILNIIDYIFSNSEENCTMHYIYALYTCGGLHR